MKFTDLFIRKPVLAVVVSLLILVLGLRSVFSLATSQYPRTENAVVTVSTLYYGADAASVAGFITQPLESSIAQAQGIDYLSSSSLNGVSTITATLRLNYSGNKALAEITTRVNAVRNQLPTEAQQPVVSIQNGSTIDAMYLGFYSDTQPTNNITDYLLRVVKPKLDSLDGVQTAEILGARNFAMRAWLDPKSMAAHGVTAADVNQALVANNYLSAIGTSKGQMVSIDLTARTDLHNADEFKQLVVRKGAAGNVRLGDVATVVLGADDYSVNGTFSGKQSVFIGIKVAPEANILDVTKRVRNVFPEIQSQLPAGIAGTINYDSSDYVNTSIHEVIVALLEALLIVIVVIFLFLGSLRAVAVPVIAMPLSLIGTFLIMLTMNYSINLLTLLALVLAIGLVVDDAIIIVENVDRHMKEGKPPLTAAMMAARELGGPIIAMTVVLVAVYVPIGFQGGLTGSLFTEFAFTLAGAVLVSGVVALTLSPMMCARIFKPSQDQGRFVQWIDRRFERVQAAYRRSLAGSLASHKVTVAMGLLLLLGAGYLFQTSQFELAPKEDQGFILGAFQGPPTATSQQMQTYAAQAFEVAKKYPEIEKIYQITGVPTPNQGIAGVILKPWDERKRGAEQVQDQLQKAWGDIPGTRVALFQPPSLPGAQGMPMQFVIKTTESFDRLHEVSEAVLAKARQSGMFFYVDSDLKVDKPQASVVVDSDLIADLGLTHQAVGTSLGAAMGGDYTNYFSISGRTYKVIPQTLQVDRLNPEQVLDNYIRTPGNALIPAATVASLTRQVVPESINHFQQLNSATISGVFSPTVSQEEVLAFMRTSLKEVAPVGFQIDHSGVSRQFVKESGGFMTTMLVALIIVFLALAAQFNSFRDPVIILVSVPMALFGALVFINLGVASINIYTQVGLVTLVGLVSKHGILIVEFANELQKAGKTKLEAILEATSIRLRPILMTTAAMVLGVFPLVIASGAGAAGRQAMGWVIFAGLSIGTLFTLFVVPAFYVLLGADLKGDFER